MSILIRSHTQHTSTWFLGQGNCVSYAYSPLGVSLIRVSASCHTRISLMPYAYGTVSYAKSQKHPATCRIRHSPKTHSFPLIPVYEIESKNQKNVSNSVRIHPQTIVYDSLTNSIHRTLNLSIIRD